MRNGGKSLVHENAMFTVQWVVWVCVEPLYEESYINFLYKYLHSEDLREITVCCNIPSTVLYLRFLSLALSNLFSDYEREVFSYLESYNFGNKTLFYLS